MSALVRDNLIPNSTLAKRPVLKSVLRRHYDRQYPRLGRKVSGDEIYIGGDTLQPQKVRLLLAFGVLNSTDRVDLQELFDIY